MKIKVDTIRCNEKKLRIHNNAYCTENKTKKRNNELTISMTLTAIETKTRGRMMHLRDLMNSCPKSPIHKIAVDLTLGSAGVQNDNPIPRLIPMITPAMTKVSGN
jgi:hypothetical protein